MLGHLLRPSRGAMRPIRPAACGPQQWMAAVRRAVVIVACVLAATGCVAPVAAQAGSHDRLLPLAGPPAAEQLAADATPVPAGQGAIFVPALSDGGSEPETLEFRNARRVASTGGRTRMQAVWRTTPVVLAWLTTVATVGGAQEPDETDNGWMDVTERSLARELEDADESWSNATELSVVRTQGNAATQTFGFKNTLRRNWARARARLRVDGVRARTAGEQVLLWSRGYVSFQAICRTSSRRA